MKLSMNNMTELFYRRIYTKIFPDYFVELKKAFKGCKTILDVGCGRTSLLRLFPKEIYRVGVEGFQPYIEESKSKGFHNEYHRVDVMEIGDHFPENSFDCVYAGDVIEHLEKEKGLILIKMMEKIAKKKVIIYTPNGFLPQDSRDSNDLQIHKSGWTVSEMEEMGFNVIGTSGWKFFRGNNTGIRFYPKFLWRVVSDITQFYTRNNPIHAKQILCVKDQRPN
jgi:SAM-dependent methyltransferase